MKPIVMMVGAISLMTMNCGDDIGAVGIFQITSHTLNAEGCTLEGPSILGTESITHFKIFQASVPGKTLMAIHGCQSADESSCSLGGLPSGFQKNDGHWVLDTYVVLSSSSWCILGLTRSELASDVDNAAIEIHTYKEEDATLIGDACTNDEAKARNTTMPCVRYERITGLRVK
jgi:hypothetical protein